MDSKKGTLTVVGEVEPVPVFKALKKIKQTPEIISVGPPKPHGPYCTCSLCRPYSDQMQKGWDPPMYPCSVPCNNPWCKQCQLVSMRYLHSDYDSGMCSIQWGPHSSLWLWAVRYVSEFHTKSCKCKVFLLIWKCLIVKCTYKYYVYLFKNVQ